MDKKSIWNSAQNKPSLIAKDLLKYGIPKDITHYILLNRGVYKWLAVRRHLIKLKNTWKSIITQTINNIHQTKKTNDIYKLGYYRGYLKAYEECRKEIRVLCHSDRWQAPDFDKEANQYLKNLEN
jgi:hypothetical protein